MSEEKLREIIHPSGVGSGMAGDSAQIEPVVPDVRSGATVPFNPLQNAAAHLVGRLAIIWSYNIASGNVQLFHQALPQAEQTIVGALVGTAFGDLRYFGTYCVAVGADFTERGRYRTIWGAKNYADIDQLNRLVFEAVTGGGSDPALNSAVMDLFVHRAQDEVDATEILVPAANSTRIVPPPATP